MPKALTEAEIDPIAEEVDEQMQQTGEQAGIPMHKVDTTGNYGDLSDGGRVGSAEVIPVGESGRVVFDKQRREPGRPTVRNVWMWDGRPSAIPLAYEPSGKRHDGGRRYLLKRHCVVCNYTGFYGQACPQCRKDGRPLAPPIAAFYLKKELVPQPGRYFGTVDCFVPVCTRRGQYGFLDEAQMRQHAMNRHRQEYRAFQDSQQARSEREIADLRAQVNALLMARIQNAPAQAAVQATVSDVAMTVCECGGGYKKGGKTFHSLSKRHKEWATKQG